MDILEYLTSLKIEYEVFEHEPVYTVEEAKLLTNHVKGMHCKNLFLRNRKGNQHYLVVLDEDREINLKELSKDIESTSLSFASKERLYEYLNLEPGSVSPFGLINDKDNHVKVILDKNIVNSETVTFHPNRNTATLCMKTNDLMRYLNIQGYEIAILD